MKKIICPYCKQEHVKVPKSVDLEESPQTFEMSCEGCKTPFEVYTEDNVDFLTTELDYVEENQDPDGNNQEAHARFFKELSERE